MSWRKCGKKMHHGGSGRNNLAGATMDKEGFWKGRKVLVTGHTGFKGAWLTRWLIKKGAEVTGFSLPNYPNQWLYDKLSMSDEIDDIRGDILDLDTMGSAFSKSDAQIVFHLAAQALVRRSYDDPVETFATNALGTANVCECIRQTDSVCTAVIVTSDKSYQNMELSRGYVETDPLGGRDPYSASKGCAELIARSYRESFFALQGKYVAQARAGNVIGGGDRAFDRLIPDCIGSLAKGLPIKVRNPDSVRPWQHVLEPLCGYMQLAKLLHQGESVDEAWNFGPMKASIRPVRDVVEGLIGHWGSGSWEEVEGDQNKHEAKLLSLDITKAQGRLGFEPRLTLDKSLEWVVSWEKGHLQGDAAAMTDAQIADYEGLGLDGGEKV